MPGEIQTRKSLGRLSRKVLLLSAYLGDSYVLLIGKGVLILHPSIKMTTHFLKFFLVPISLYMIYSNTDAPVMFLEDRKALVKSVNLFYGKIAGNN